MPRPRLVPNSRRSSPVSDTLLDTKCCNGFTSTVDSHSSATTLLNTTVRLLTTLLAREPERLLCTLLPEGMLFHADFLKSMANWFSLVGIGEIVLLPLDVLKIKRQTNPEAFRGRGLFKIISDEGMGLYRGAGWTAARNAPGSFAVCLSLLGCFLYFY